MKQLVRFSVEKLVTIIMVVLAVVVFGVVSFNRLTTDLFPDVNIPFAVVLTTYPGATPDEVEQEVSVPLEEVFSTTANVNEMTTQSQENFSMVMLEFEQDADMDTALVDMREAINQAVDNLPDEASNPAIMRLNPEMLPVMNFSVSYEGKDIEELTEWVDDTLRPRIERISGVGNVGISGGYESEVRVTLDQEKIDEANDEIATLLELAGQEDLIDEVQMDKEFISNVLMAQNFAFPAGFVDVGGTEYMVRVGDDIEDLDELRNLKIFGPEAPGVPLQIPNYRVEDLAEVDFAEAGERRYSKVDGQDAITVNIQRSSGYATTEVTEEVHQALDELQEEEAFTITTLLDQGEYINMATSNVLQNLIIGGLLAIAVLLVFLRSIKMTFIVGVAIPISLTAAIIMIYLAGITLNIVSLGGLALGIGMLVDNSIVVIENIFRMKREGATNKDASIHGAQQVAGAIFASTLTTVSVFLPIMFIEDFIREIFFQLALTITFSLLASLLIALTFVPTVATRIMSGADTSGLRKTPDRKPFIETIKNLYGRILHRLFKLKPIVLGGVLVLFGLTFFLAISRGFEFFPPTDEGTVRVTLEPDPEDPIDFETFTDYLDQFHEDVRAFEDVESVGITLGGDMAMLGFTGAGGGESATANIVLREDREQSTVEVADAIAALLEADYDRFESEVTGTETDASALIGEGIQIQLKGTDLDVLREEALKVADELEDIDGLRNIDPGLGRPQQEVRVSVDKDVAMSKGLTVAQVLEAVSDYLEGPRSATSIRMDGRSFDVYVYDEEETRRTAVADLDELRALEIGEDFLSGDAITLDSVADVNYDAGFQRITRVDGARSVTVSADYETGVNTTRVAREVEDTMEAYDLPGGYAYETLGEDEEIQAAIDTLLLVGALGIMLVYMVMASQFQSFAYPLIIMVTIPLAFTGGFGILYLSGNPVSIVAIIGLIILAGVVVNNGIVLVDYINQLRARGYALQDAIIEAGKIRLRPIFMTAITTILALTVLAIGIGEGTELTQPMALTAIGGLVYATFLTIFVVPIMYDVLTRYNRITLAASVVLIGLGFGLYYSLVEWSPLFIALAAGLIVGAILIAVFFPETREASGEVEHDA